MNGQSLPDLSHLTLDERKKILDVLNRDEILQKKQNDKLSRLRQEIDILESKSIDLPTEHIENANICVRCKQSFGYFYFYNQGDFCPKCQYKVCQKCQVYQLDIRNKWLCILCHKYNQYLVQTGTWIHSDQDMSKQTTYSNTTKLRKDSLSGSQLIKITLLPDKKDEILGEIKKTKSTLTRTSSVLKSKRPNNTKQNQRPTNTSITTSSALDNFTNKNLHTRSIASLNDSNRSSTAESSRSSSNYSFQPGNNTHKPVINNNNNLFDIRKLSVVTNPLMTSPLKTGFTYDLKNKEHHKTLVSGMNSLKNNTKSILSPQLTVHRSSIIKNTENDKLNPNRNTADKRFQFAISNESVNTNNVRIKSDNDLDSVTSSEIDSQSLNVTAEIKSTQLKKDNKNENLFKMQAPALNENNSDEMNNVRILENNKLYSLKENKNHLINRDESMSKISNRSQVSISSMMSKKTNQSENDDTFMQMDKIFAQARESIKHEDINNNTVTHEEENEEDLRRQSYLDNLVIDADIISPLNSPKITEKNNKFRNLTSHMSLMRRSKKRFERAASMKSIDQEYDFDNSDIQGKIQLKLDYDKKSSNLNVNILKCTNLAMVANKACDSYVKIYLIPGNKEKNNKRKTSIKKNTISPEYNETLRYTLSHIELCRNKVWVSCWHSDKFGRNKFLGEISIQLDPEVLYGKEPSWYELKKRNYYIHQNLAIDKVFGNVNHDHRDRHRDSFHK